MNNTIRENLCELIKNRGLEIINNEEDFSLIFKKYCSQNYKIEINTIIDCLKYGLVKEIIEMSKSFDSVSCLSYTALKMHYDFSVIREYAVWAINSWAIALKLFDEKEILKTEAGQSFNQNSHSNFDNPKLCGLYIKDINALTLLPGKNFYIYYLSAIALYDNGAEKKVKPYWQCDAGQIEGFSYFTPSNAGKYKLIAKYIENNIMVQTEIKITIRNQDEYKISQTGYNNMINHRILFAVFLLVFAISLIYAVSFFWGLKKDSIIPLIYFVTFVFIATIGIISNLPSPNFLKTKKKYNCPAYSGGTK